MTSAAPRPWFTSALSALGTALAVTAAVLLGFAGEIAGARAPTIAAAAVIVVLVLVLHASLPRPSGLVVAAICVVGCLGLGAAGWLLTGPARAGAPVAVQTELVPWASALAAIGVALIAVAARAGGIATARSNKVATGGGAAAGIALATAITLVVVPWQVAVRNTESTGADATAPPAAGPPELTGRVGWSGRYTATSAAGPVVATEHGVGVLDRRTGRMRWSHQQWDRVFADFDAEGVAATTPDGRAVVTVAERADDTSEVLVFDAVSGQRQHAWRTDHSRIVTATDDHVLMTSTATPTDRRTSPPSPSKATCTGSTAWLVPAARTPLPSPGRATPWPCGAGTTTASPATTSTPGRCSGATGKLPERTSR